MKYSLQDLDLLASKIAQNLRPDDVVGFSGPLGAGKTTLIKSIAAQFGVAADEVTSPTYVYHHMYRGTLDVHHMDLYRIEHETTLHSLDLVDATYHGGISLIEWIDLFPDVFTPYIHIHIHQDTDVTRELTLTNKGWNEDRFALIQEAL